MAKSYVGIQLKKGDLVYRSGGAKGSLKEAKNQAEEAFEREIYDLDGKAVHFISRFVVATTGDINEPARKHIGKARLKGSDRQIHFWTGERLAEYIQEHWMKEFEDYFAETIAGSPETEDDLSIIDAEYITEQYQDVILAINRVSNIVNRFEWPIIRSIARVGLCYSDRPSMTDLLMELGRPEDYFRDEFNHLTDLGLIDIDENGIALVGYAQSLARLCSEIERELVDADEDISRAAAIFDAIVQK